MVWIFTLFAFVEPTYIAYKLYDIDAHPSKYPEATFTQFVITGTAVWVGFSGSSSLCPS